MAKRTPTPSTDSPEVVAPSAAQAQHAADPVAPPELQAKLTIATARLATIAGNAKAAAERLGKVADCTMVPMLRAELAFAHNALASIAASAS